MPGRSGHNHCVAQSSPIQAVTTSLENQYYPLVTIPLTSEVLVLIVMAHQTTRRCEVKIVTGNQKTLSPSVWIIRNFSTAAKGAEAPEDRLQIFMKICLNRLTQMGSTSMVTVAW
jgi:hypothetical protein